MDSDFTIKVDERPRCVAVLKTGKNVGLTCKNPALQDCEFCGVHKRSYKKNQIVPINNNGTTCAIGKKQSIFSCFG
jgi:hypothetical protein